MTITSEISAASLPVYRVEVAETGQSTRHHWARCEIGENLAFDHSGLEAYCLANWDDRVYDAFVVAAAVQFCDHTKARPATGWGREIVLRIPVHDPSRWKSQDVSTALHDALTLLTGDRWRLIFVPRKTEADRPHQGRFTLPEGSRVVMPYSDGLDSCAVGRLAEREHGHALIRVRLGPKLFGGGQCGIQLQPFAAVPYRVRYGKRGSREASARSRGFRFALLSGIAAYLSQSHRIVMTESGQGALGPALVPVGQAYEDYRNHPLFTCRMQKFVSALFGHVVHYTFPRLWFTKGETLRAFAAEFPDDASWAYTRSCWQGQRQVSVRGRMRQCGTCAACMLRRMSVHTAGLTEDCEAYVWEDLGATRYEDGAAQGFARRNASGALYEYAIAGTLHLAHLAGLRQTVISRAGLEHQAFQLGRALGISQDDARVKLDRLLMRHKEELRNFVGSLGPASFVARWVGGAS